MEVISSEERFRAVLANNSHVVAYFTAGWCVKCRSITPCVESAAVKLLAAKFVKIDMDENHYAVDLGVTKIPHIIFYENGSKSLEFVETTADQLSLEIQAFSDSITESNHRMESESKSSDVSHAAPSFSFEYITIPANKNVLNLPAFLSGKIPFAINRQLPLSINPLEIAYLMNRCISVLFAEVVSDDGRGVKYHELSSSSSFHNYINSTYLLTQVQFISDHRLLILTDEVERKVFFLNLYNSLTCHAKLSQKISPSNMPFYSSSSYLLGDGILSLDDIEHGILRGNSPHPSQVNAVAYNPDMEMIQLMKLPIDPRIHCSLNCGAKSCPPIRIFDVLNLEQALTLASNTFVSGETEINEAEVEILTSKIFFWYKNDFKPDVVSWIGQFLDEGKRARIGRMVNPTVKFRDYDWKLNEFE